MKSVCSCFTKFSSLFAWVLSCFDRVIFKGYLPLSQPQQLEMFVDHVLRIRRTAFLKELAPRWSRQLVQHAKDYARRHGRLFAYRQGKIDKDAWAKEQLRLHPQADGLIGVLCVQETCPTFQLAFGEGRPRFQSRAVPQRVLYYYFYDRQLGMIHVRLQTWAPFTCQVYVNGHNFLAQQLCRRGLAFVQQDNAFIQLEDPPAAQRCADRFVKLPWPRLLERYAKLVNPLLQRELKGLTHYWVTDQAEYATDLLFHDKPTLAGLFGRLVEYAWLTFSPRRVLGFLGRKWHDRFDGKVQSYCKTEREPGVCIKHQMKGNRLKMYDKFGLLLRVETIINQPGEFKVYRECQHRDGSRSLGWFSMCKGVGNLPHYQTQALACNRRYLEALSAVDAPAVSTEEVEQLTERRRHRGRSTAGFNPARSQAACLFRAVLAGDHIAQGFRNQDIRERLYGISRDRRQRRRQSAAVGRLLKRLHVRGLLAKVPHRRRWRVTERGRRLLGEMLRAYGQHQREVA